jgi:predicted amidohydrolase
MKIALAVPYITNDMNVNVCGIKNIITEACKSGASFVLLPEAVLTGLNITDEYNHDIELAVSIENQIITMLGNMAKENKIWLCFGFLENDNDCIFNSAVLIDPNGEITIHHKRISPYWRAKDLPSHQYAEGITLHHTITPLGKTVIVICGDLFYEDVIKMLDLIKPDVVLFPMARCFSPKYINSQQDWDSKGIYEYTPQAKRIKSTILLSNLFAINEIGGGFGGAAVIDKNGNILTSELPLCHKGILYYEFNKAT